MLFDDRLATVLRHPAQSEAGARTQYRQLLDLLGSMPEDLAEAAVEAAYDRLGELAEELPQGVQAAILRAPGLRLRSRSLLAFLARGEPQAAAAALATAELDESDWLRLIPGLPLTARGFLRHRRDLPFSARQVLDRLGVRDLVLPEPERAAPANDMEQRDAPPPPAPPPTPPPPPSPADAEAGIGALVRRIEAFQRARRDATAAPRLELGNSREQALVARRAFDFATDAQGEIVWADPAMAPLVVGMRLGPMRPGAAAQLDEAGALMLARRQPLRRARAQLAGAAEIAGEWRIDAAPAFDPAGGQFAGYRGRLRRPGPARPQSPATDEGDRLRQLLHELRTPVGAIQGFAELIQQQLFGPAPNAYRALAAAVAVDAARLLAGFDEIDRLARLETGVGELDEGHSDLREATAQILRRLEGVLRQRNARIDLVATDAHFTVGLAEPDALQLAWRLLATLAGMLAPGEVIQLSLESDGQTAALEADLPIALLDVDDLFAASAPSPPRAVTAGMFGSGFTLRLARAEAAAGGGALERRDDRLRLTLPVLTGPAAPHTVVGEGDGNGP